VKPAVFPSAIPSPRAIQGGAGGDVWCVSPEALYYFLPPLRMMQGSNLIGSFVHGNALGVILEPRGLDGVPEKQRADLWKVCIGPLVEEVAIGSEYPKEDFDNVVKDLSEFLESKGVSRSITSTDR
jgi:hypothetical protein